MTRNLEDRQVYPHVKEKIGEDPARFLDRDLVSGKGLALVKARIRGIDRLEVIALWRGVEEDLIRTPENGRGKIRRLLQKRARELEEIGERPDRLEYIERISPDETEDVDDEPTVWRHVADDCQSTDVEQLSSMAFQCGGCEKRVPTARVEAIEA